MTLTFREQAALITFLRLRGSPLCAEALSLIKEKLGPLGKSILQEFQQETPGHKLSSTAKTIYRMAHGREPT